MLASGLAPGGSATYAGLTAAALGVPVRVATSFGPDFCGRDLLAAAGVTVENLASARTTTFENVYDAAGLRHGRVLAVAETLVRPVDADVVFCCPVIDEVAMSTFAGRLVGAGLQGWLRRLDPDGAVRPKPIGDPGRFAGCHVAFASDEDVDDLGELFALRDVVPVVVITHGVHGAEVHAEGRTLHVAACEAEVEVDLTGAGDVFATAFLLALGRGESLASAGAHGACAASIVVEAPGPAALGRLARDLPCRLDAYHRRTRI